jgi:hypothetical protein
MRRIESPAGAGESEVWLEKMRLSEYQAVQAHREKMLGVVHKEVEKYLNTRDLVYDDEDGFPNRSRMTGEYYLGSESYIGNNEGGWIKVGIECCCQEKPSELYPEGGDYLGLTVWLRCTPRRGAFKPLGTDSASI